MRFTLEEALADEPVLFELFAQNRGEEVAAWGWGEAELQTFLAMQFRFQQQSYRMQFPVSHIQLIKVEDQTVGMLRTAATESDRVLVDIILTASYRNKGIGTELILMLQEEARASGLPLKLTVLRDNLAKRLYKRLGFTVFLEDELYEHMRWQG
ncbi:GNAT family N-acetyltransferase [Paenibacillus sp. FJAT-27812]|uniref:GNAT family N-acetyltransferase n=1 Tax=Paenibacillus sp. FJAT-27812 TaxID=1684143 RepID=UPI0006A7E184|nr:GNAT family N-acetyltransferase [Paenibacillus sp. FJAT-27812]